MIVRRPYLLRVFHKGAEVACDRLDCVDLRHAHEIAAYVANTACREAVHPRDLDLGRVSFEVDEASTS